MPWYGFSLEEFLLHKFFQEVSNANATSVQPKQRRGGAQSRSVTCSQGMPRWFVFLVGMPVNREKKAANSALI